jgi:hypothetical protein
MYDSLQKIGFLLFLLSGFIASTLIGAETQIKAATDLTIAASTLPELKIGLTQSFTFPFLQGNSPLTADNNIKTALTAEIAPVSLNFIAQATWTPIAFFQLVAGGKVGSGWNIQFLGSDIYGIGIHRRSEDGTGVIRGSAFEGCFWGLYAGGVLQGDLAVLFPGDWHHLVFRTYHELNYKGFSAASKEETWVFENSARENRNGFNYYGNYLLGYQMPLFLNMVGVLVEIDAFLYDTPNREQWGDELGRWLFAGLFNFRVTQWMSAALIVQGRTQRNYDDESLFYQDRRLNTADPRRLEFYRVAVILSFKLH